MKSIDVSVIIPMFNAARTIRRCVTSALSQDGKSIEVIAIDDGSDDETISIVQSLRDPRVRIVCNQTNLGPSAARNRGLELAQGKWIAFLDADDWWHPARLARLFASSRDFRATILADDVAIVRRESTRVVNTIFRLVGVRVRSPVLVRSEDLLRLHMLQFQPLVQRSFIEANGIRFREDVRVGEDQFFLLELLLAGATMAITPEPLYFYELPSNPREARRLVEYLERLVLLVDSLGNAKSPHLDSFRRYCSSRSAEYFLRGLVGSVRRRSRRTGGLDGPRNFGLGDCSRVGLRLVREYLRLRFPQIAFWPLFRSGSLG